MSFHLARRLYFPLKFSCVSVYASRSIASQNTDVSQRDASSPDEVPETERLSQDEIFQQWPGILRYFNDSDSCLVQNGPSPLQ
jgi:hypothetical protein